jgi:hypothetical protein
MKWVEELVGLLIGIWDAWGYISWRAKVVVVLALVGLGTVIYWLWSEALK